MPGRGENAWANWNAGILFGLAILFFKKFFEKIFLHILQQRTAENPNQ